MTHAGRLEAQLKTEFPGRAFRVYPGDCNITIHDALADLESFSWAPAFAFIDPNGPDYTWGTLMALADFKTGRKYKVELWMLFPEPMFVRLLLVRGDEVRPRDTDRITGMSGTEQWWSIYEARLGGVLEPRAARAEYINLMRWRLENVVGYKWTHSFEVHNERGHPIYHLIFASDHPAGNQIMTHLYRRALGEFPQMRRQAVDRRRGTPRLFEDAPQPDEYQYEPPWLPYGAAQ